MPGNSGRSGEPVQRPRPGIQSPSDLIFGLAMRIGGLKTDDVLNQPGWMEV